NVCPDRLRGVVRGGGGGGPRQRGGLRPGLGGPRGGLQHPPPNPPLRPRPAAGHLRRLQEAALPLGLWRLADPAQALALAAAPRRRPDPRAEARIRAWLAQLAGRGGDRRGGGRPHISYGDGWGTFRA